VKQQTIIVENDPTKEPLSSAVIIAGGRTGGTFLAHCLSSHPDIFCDRGEPLHHASVWHTNLTLDRVKLLYCLTHMQGYRVSMCKLLYQQAFKPEVWDYVVKTQPRVIWLTRDNTIRQAVSIILNRLAREGKIEHPAHSFDDVKPVQVELAPDQVLGMARKVAALYEYARNELTKMGAVLHITYEQVAQNDGKLSAVVGREVCEFLDVRYRAMACDLKRVNPLPLKKIVTNWRDVSAAIKGSEFRACLEGE